MYGRGIRRFDSAEGVCSMLAEATVLNYDVFAYFERLATITADDIMKRLDVFVRECSVLSVVNPKTEED